MESGDGYCSSSSSSLSIIEKTCFECPKNTFRSKNGENKCIECPKGTVSNVASEECRKCQDGECEAPFVGSVGFWSAIFFPFVTILSCLFWFYFKKKRVKYVWMLNLPEIDDHFNDSENEELLPKQFKLKGIQVHAKIIPSLTQKSILKFNELHEIRHPNLVEFLGICPYKFDSVLMFSELCVKGSLRDLLKNEGQYLSWVFKFSFIGDLCKG